MPVGLLALATLLAPATLPAQTATAGRADAAAADRQAAPTLRGRVGAEDGQPVRGARVAVGLAGSGPERLAQTDEQGRFELRGLPAGRHAVRVQALGFRPVERSVTVGDAAAATLDVVLERIPTVLTAQVTTATRTASALSDIPGAVSVVGREELDDQMALSANLAGALGKVLPGLGPATGTPSLFGQALRGRDISVLIDGVPLSTTRNVGRDLVTIDPAMIERVEVLRGASAIYGDGATGGIINIITRRPEIGRARLTTDVRAIGSLSAPGNGGGLRVAQSAAGTAGRVSYVIGGSVDRTGAHYDAEGDRIPADPNGQGGLSDTDAWDVLAKLGIEGETHRLQLTLNHYDATQSTRYATVPAADTGAKSRARSGLELDTPQGSVNSLASLDYTHAGVPALLGSRLHVQGYARDYFTRFGPFGRRLVRPSTGSTAARTYVLQSFVDSWKAGGRLELETPVPALRDAAITWGADYNRERTYQGLNHFDKAAYDASGGLVHRKTDEWYWVPPMNVQQLGVFAQGAWRPLPRLMLRGGLRHERDRVSVDDFATIEEVPVTGGTLRFSPTVYNAGAVLTAGRGVELFTNFSQGFSLGDLGRILRQAPPGFTLGSRSTEATTVDQWEYGARALWSRTQATLSYFRSRSELGTQIDTNFRVLRAPERIQGVEATLDVQPGARLEFGGTATWTEGDFLDVRTDRWKALNGFRIAPPKATAYLALRPLAGWQTRLQLLSVGSRDRAALDAIGYGGRPVEGYTTVDWLNSLRVGPGLLTVGVENLLDRQYYTLPSQLMGSGSWAHHSAARGAVLTVGYGVTY